MHQITSGETARKLTGDGRDILRASRKIANWAISTLEAPVAEVFNNRILGGSDSDALRILSSYAPVNDNERVTRSLMLISAYRAEQSSPVSAALFLRLLAGKTLSNSSPRKLVSSDIEKLISAVNDKTVEEMLAVAIRMLGPTGNLTVTLGGLSHISVDESSSFPVIVSPSFASAGRLTSRVFIVFDGVIESVGQVHRLLDDCAKNGVSAILLARAFSSEVASTIHTNNSRGIFDIIPVTPGVSIDDEYTVHDIAGVTGAVLSPILSLENSSKESDVIIEKGMLKVNIRNDFWRNEHLKRLRHELSLFKDEHIKGLISRRIARISGRRITVCIGEEFGDLSQVCKERFDYGMRCFMSARLKGVTVANEKTLPGDSIHVAKMTHDAYLKLAQNTGGVLALDKKMAVAKRRRG